MKELDLTSIKKVHFVGVGGIGMSAIARMFLLEGKIVTGSDVNHSMVTHELEKHGAQIFYTQESSHVAVGTNLVVYTIAIPDTNPELVEARRLGIPVYSYPEMLGVISKEKYTIAVSGTHGKTTTTAMIAKVLMDAGLDPTVIVGSFLIDAQSNFVAGKSNYLVVEACEYKRSFLNLHPNILVITNIDDDHLDYYKDTADIQSAFSELASRLAPDDFVVTNPTETNIVPVADGLSCAVLDYTSVDTKNEITLPGNHNKKNARAALVVASILGIDEAAAIASLNNFKGTWRRFEHKGKTKNGAEVYDDYAHHPTEIEATLSMTRELFPEKKIIVAFQPHLYSRTKEHVHEFAQAFKDADSVLLAPIYAARESEDLSISSEILAEKIRAAHAGDIASFSSLEELGAALSAAQSDSIIVIMGAGDITKVADMIVL